MYIDGAHSHSYTSNTQAVKRVEREDEFKIQERQKGAEASGSAPAGAAEVSAGPMPISENMMQQIIKLLETSGAGKKEGDGISFSKEDLESLKSSEQVTEELKTAIDKLTAALDKAAGQAAQGASAEDGGVLGQLPARFENILKKLMEEKDRKGEEASFSLHDLEALKGSDKTSKEDKALIEELIAFLKNDTARFAEKQRNSSEVQNQSQDDDADADTKEAA
ncbi:MAG: hypothetical protein ACYYKD_10075 [Rhodospirillales bacterium]